jgi:arylsulfatase A-like enzyme
MDTLSAGLYDILPTIAGFTGAVLSAGVEGVDLFKPRDPNRPIPSSGLWPDHCYHSEIEAFESTACVLSGNLKGTVNFTTGFEFMHDLTDDPHELKDLPLNRDLLNQVELYWTTPPLGNPPPVNREGTDSQLEGLGYI